MADRENEDKIKGETEDRFRESFKYFKRKKPTPDLSHVFDVRCLAEKKDFAELKPFSPYMPVNPPVPGLQPVKFWQIFSFSSHPGFLFILNPFLPFFDRIWAKHCLKDYTCKPNHCNLDGHESHDTEFWQRCINSNASVRQTLLNKLRWVTFGFHHNWDTKVYSLDDHSAFPLELSHLACYVASAVGFQNYLPEAAIVNYYPVGSTLSGHTDHSEFDHESPIISFSFGCSAIFLLGGATKKVKPMPIYIHSGDIVVMFGPGRLNYHGVPRIIPDSWHPCSRPGSASSKSRTSLDAVSNESLTVTANLLENSKTDAKNDIIIENSLDSSYNQMSKDLRCHTTANISQNDALFEHKALLLPFPTDTIEDKLRFNCEKDSCILDLDGELQSVNEIYPVTTEVFYSESHLCDSIAASDELLINEYLRTSRININVRQVFVKSNVEESCIT